MNYRFPESRFTSNSIPKQFFAVLSECFEVAKAFVCRDWQHMIVECYDVIHTTETLIRIIVIKYNVSALLARKTVRLKNEMRGYYIGTNTNIKK